MPRLARALPRAAVVLALTLVGLALPVPAASAQVRVVLPQLDAVLLGAVDPGLPAVATLPREARFVALSWLGERHPEIELSTSPDGLSWSDPAHAEPEESGNETSARTYSAVHGTGPARFVRVTSDHSLRDVRVVGISDGQSVTRTQRLRRGTAAAAVEQPDVISRAQWGADESRRTGTRSYHPVQKLIVHHTADDTAKYSDPAAHVRAIYAYHTAPEPNGRAYNDIAYHFLLAPDGKVFEGRYARDYAAGEEPTGELADGRVVTGAHAANYNSGTMGMALLGNYVDKDIAAPQRASLVSMLSWAADRHDLDPLGRSTYRNPSGATTPDLPNIIGHRDVGATACPGGTFYATLPAVRQAVRDKVDAVLDGELHPLVPARILDTRFGTGGSQQPVGPAESRLLQVAGVGGVPADGAIAVVLNLTATAPTKAGYLTAYPADVARPNASNVNFRAGQSVPNLVTVGLSPEGRVRVFNSAGETDVIADVVGWYGDSSVPGGRFTAVTPARLLDTRRPDGGGPVLGGTSRDLVVVGKAGVPSGGVTAVMLNVTGIAPTASLYVTAWPAGAERPNASNLNLVPGRTAPNLVLAKVGSGGKVSLFGSAGAVDLAVDVVGWFGPGTDGSRGRFTPVTPARLVDTRGTFPLGVGESRSVLAGGAAGVPVGAAAVVVNITAVGPTKPGYLTVFPADRDLPGSSTVNFVTGDVVPNLAVVGLSPGGELAVYNSHGETNVIVDVVGWYAAA